MIGILAALRKRDLTGRGAAIDMPMHDCLVAMLMVEPMEAQVGWGYPLRTGSRIPRLAPCNVYLLSRRLCRSQRRAAASVAPAGQGDGRARAGSCRARSAGGPHSAAGLARPAGRRLGRQQTVDALVAVMAANGVPCAKVVETLQELAEDPSLREHGCCNR